MCVARVAWQVAAFAALLAAAACAPSRSTAAETVYYSCEVVSRPFPETLVVVEPAPSDSLAGFDWAAIADSVRYPEFARRAGVEGTVSASVAVSPEGRPLAVWLTRSPNDLLSEASKAALMIATYTPAPDYQTVVDVRVVFRLRY